MREPTAISFNKLQAISAFQPPFSDFLILFHTGKLKIIFFNFHITSNKYDLSQTRFYVIISSYNFAKHGTIDKSERNQTVTFYNFYINQTLRYNFVSVIPPNTQKYTKWKEIAVQTFLPQKFFDVKKEVILR